MAVGWEEDFALVGVVASRGGDAVLVDVGDEVVVGELDAFHLAGCAGGEAY